MVIGAGGSAVTVHEGLLNAAWLTEAAMARYQTSRGVGGAGVGSGRESR